MMRIIFSMVCLLSFLALRKAMRGKISLQLQYALWEIVALRLLIPGSFGTSNLSFENIWSYYEQNLSRIVQQYDSAALLQKESETWNTDRTPYRAENQTGKNEVESEIILPNKDEQSMVIQRGVTVSEIIQLVWIIGMVFITSYVILHNIHFASRLRRRERTQRR